MTTFQLVNNIVLKVNRDGSVPNFFGCSTDTSYSSTYFEKNSIDFYNHAWKMFQNKIILVIFNQSLTLSLLWSFITTTLNLYIPLNSYINLAIISTKIKKYNLLRMRNASLSNFSSTKVSNHMTQKMYWEGIHSRKVWLQHIRWKWNTTSLF